MREGTLPQPRIGPSHGYLGRMRIYLAEMYPLPRRILIAFLFAGSFVTLLARIHGVTSGWWSSLVLRGGLGVFFLMLILRLMDELKDEDVDRALFAHRPLPSGRVLGSDIRISLALACLLFLLVHTGAGLAFLTSILVLGYAFLMFRWFFVPDLMRPHLFLTLATHNPVIPLLCLHLLALFVAEHGLGAERVRWIPSLLPVAAYWAATFAWEIARKIRSRQEENAYVTYSRLLGPGGAVGLAAAAQAVPLVAGVALHRAGAVSLFFPLACGTGLAAVLLAHLRFLLDPNPRTSRLAPYAELNILSVLVGGCLA